MARPGTHAWRKDTFDLLAANGKYWRTERLIDRKQELRRLLRQIPTDSRLKYVEHVDGTGTALFEQVCKLDLEGIVAKLKSGPYVSDRESSTWLKIRNPRYSQWAGREELFERDRHEPVAGGTLACWPRIRGSGRLKASMQPLHD